MPDVSLLRVLLHGRPIGTLSFHSGEKTIFTFSAAYADDPLRSTLSLSFKDVAGDLITDLPASRLRLPPFFSNLLPEGALRDYLAARAGVKPQREFFLLWVLGKDLPGALTVEPGDNPIWPPEIPSESGGSALPPDSALRFSLAGVQLKFSAIGEARGGLTIPAEGVGGSWIVKLPSTQFARVPENEYSMMTLARRIGIDVPPVELIPLDLIHGLPRNLRSLQGPALAVCRFDRTGEGPVHMEDFAQVFGVYPDDKYSRASYAQIGKVLWREIGEPAVTEFIRRLVYNTLIGNADMHLKNWSILYPDKRHAALAPAYDFVSTVAYLEDEQFALKLVKSRKFAEFSLQALAHLAAQAGIGVRLVHATARETVERFQDAWPQARKDLPLEPSVISAIEAHFRRIPLWRELTGAAKPT